LVSGATEFMSIQHAPGWRNAAAVCAAASAWSAVTSDSTIRASASALRTSVEALNPASSIACLREGSGSNAHAGLAQRAAAQKVLPASPNPIRARSRSMSDRMQPSAYANQ
tara:strand:- start:1120 stop:1452 length:333 start_codon:yes stop_codon:yes gene_type:complete